MELNGYCLTRFLAHKLLLMATFAWLLADGFSRPYYAKTYAIAPVTTELGCEPTSAGGMRAACRFDARPGAPVYAMISGRYHPPASPVAGFDWSGWANILDCSGFRVFYSPFEGSGGSRPVRRGERIGVVDASGHVSVAMVRLNSRVHPQGVREPRFLLGREPLTSLAPWPCTRREVQELFNRRAGVRGPPR